MFVTKRRLGGALGAVATSAIALMTGVAPAAATTPQSSPVPHAGPMPHTATTGVADASALISACPIDGDRELQDSWGWPRSGGRRHQGIDVSAPYGTELYAVRDGEIDVKQSRLGGNAVWLVTDEGDRFYYAHLDGFAGGDRRVEAGELIGWVGSTGNAGGPHLHFETHPGGDVTNPYPYVVNACAAPDATASLDAFLSRVAVARIADAALGDRVPERAAGSPVAMPV